MRRSKNITTGFTLIETLVSLTILLIALVSGARLLSTLTTANVVNQDKFFATYLAQECLEIARNVRDTNWLQSKPWDDNLLDENTNVDSFLVRRLVTPLESETIQIEAGTDRVFSTKKRITCTVEWENIGGEQSLSISQILTNWRKK